MDLGLERLLDASPEEASRHLAGRAVVARHILGIMKRAEDAMPATQLTASGSHYPSLLKKRPPVAFKRITPVATAPVTPAPAPPARPTTPAVVPPAPPAPPALPPVAAPRAPVAAPAASPPVAAAPQAPVAAAVPQPQQAAPGPEIDVGKVTEGAGSSVLGIPGMAAERGLGMVYGAGQHLGNYMRGTSLGNAVMPMANAFQGTRAGQWLDRNFGKAGSWHKQADPPAAAPWWHSIPGAQTAVSTYQNQPPEVQKALMYGGIGAAGMGGLGVLANSLEGRKRRPLASFLTGAALGGTAGGLAGYFGSAAVNPTSTEQQSAWEDKVNKHNSPASNFLPTYLRPGWAHGLNLAGSATAGIGREVYLQNQRLSKAYQDMLTAGGDTARNLRNVTEEQALGAMPRAYKGGRLFWKSTTPVGAPIPAVQPIPAVPGVSAAVPGVPAFQATKGSVESALRWQPAMTEGASMGRSAARLGLTIAIPQMLHGLYDMYGQARDPAETQKLLEELKAIQGTTPGYKPPQLPH